MNDELKRLADKQLSDRVHHAMRHTEKIHNMTHSSKEQEAQVASRDEIARKFKVIKEESQKKETKNEMIKIKVESEEEPTKSFANIQNIKNEEKKSETLNIPYKNKVIVKSKQKTNSLIEWMKEIWRFGVTAGTIFAVLFVGMNFQAFSQILDKKINSDKYTEARIELEKITKESDTHRAKRLPTAGIKRDNVKEFPNLNIPIYPLEKRIVIPKIAKNIPIVEISDESLVSEDWKKLEKDVQDGLKNGVVHYPGTAEPGQIGNVFITGHSSYYIWDDGKYKDVFALLHDLDEGDEFTIYWGQNKFDYKISEIKVVSPKDTTVLDQPKSQKIATLMTCTPVGTSKNRLILTAEQISKS
ncbi:MAG: sortase [Candidatus Gracilibacteria bacterium]|jgi:sortase A|nr:sortase [Candidatus Gracilibacteria bacterium]